MNTILYANIVLYLFSVGPSDMFHPFLSTTGTSYIYARHKHTSMCLEVSYPRNRMEGIVNGEVTPEIFSNTDTTKYIFHRVYDILTSAHVDPSN